MTSSARASSAGGASSRQADPRVASVRHAPSMCSHDGTRWQRAVVWAGRDAPVAALRPQPGGRFGEAGLKHLDDFISRLGLAVVVALHVGAAFAAQECQLLPCLD